MALPQIAIKFLAWLPLSLLLFFFFLTNIDALLFLPPPFPELDTDLIGLVWDTSREL